MFVSQASGCEDVASSIAGSVRQYGRRVPLAEMVARIDATTAKDVKAVSCFTLHADPGGRKSKTSRYLGDLGDLYL